MQIKHKGKADILIEASILQINVSTMTATSYIRNVSFKNSDLFQREVFKILHQCITLGTPKKYVHYKIIFQESTEKDKTFLYYEIHPLSPFPTYISLKYNLDYMGTFLKKKIAIKLTTQFIPLKNNIFI